MDLPSSGVSVWTGGLQQLGKFRNQQKQVRFCSCSLKFLSISEVPFLCMSEHSVVLWKCDRFYSKYFSRVTVMSLLVVVGVALWQSLVNLLSEQLIIPLIRLIINRFIVFILFHCLINLFIKILYRWHFPGWYTAFVRTSLHPGRCCSQETTALCAMDAKMKLFSLWFFPEYALVGRQYVVWTGMDMTLISWRRGSVSTTITAYGWSTLCVHDPDFVSSAIRDLCGCCAAFYIVGWCFSTVVRSHIEAKMPTTMTRAAKAF